MKKTLAIMYLIIIAMLITEGILEHEWNISALCGWICAFVLAIKPND